MYIIYKFFSFDDLYIFVLFSGFINFFNLIATVYNNKHSIKRYHYKIFHNTKKYVKINLL